MDKEKQKQFKECELCGSNASCLCFECICYFCERCYKVIHDIKNNPKHKKENIDLFVPIDVKCSIHPKDRMSLFCIDEKGNTNINITYFFYI